MTAALLLGAGDSPGPQRFVTGLHRGVEILIHQTAYVREVTIETLKLALFATAVAAVVGIPFGALLGLGRSRAARIGRGVANTLTRVPPVASGVVVLLLVQTASPWGGGPLAGLRWYYNGGPQAGYLAQTLLAVPIVIALTASAVQSVPSGLLDQARSYGASRGRCAVLAVREARRATFAGVIVAMGVTITAVGALAVTASSQGTLAVRALQAYQSQQFGAEPPDAVERLYPGQSLAVAYSIILMGLFLLVAAALTFLQEKRSSSASVRALVMSG